MKKLWIQDSYHSEGIALMLQKIYGDCVEVHYSNNDNAVIPPKNIDVFFISGIKIYHGELPISLKRLREVYGVPNARIVAMSVSKRILDSLKEKNERYQIDFFFNKDCLSVSPGLIGRTKITPEQEQLLKSFLD